MSLVLDMSSKTQTSLKNEARQHSDERWRAAFENSAIGIMMADVNGRLFAANRVFRNMLGYSELELYQLTFLDVTYDEDRHNNLKLVRELVDDQRRDHITGCSTYSLPRETYRAVPLSGGS